MIIRSQGDALSASSQKTVSGALAAAETGVANYQAFISQNTALAVYPNTSWQTVSSSSPSPSSSSSPSPSPSSSSSCSSSSSSSSSSSNTSNSSSSTLSIATGSGWQNITDTNNVNQGQYQLVSYNYTPDSGVAANTAPGVGTLTVLGRVKQNGANPATTKLVIRIPVLSTSSAGTGTSSQIVPTGLWAKSFAGGLSNDSVINANVLDSACTASGDIIFPAGKTLGTVSDGNPATADPRATLTRAIKAFPPLPNNNNYAPPASNVNNMSAMIRADGTTLTLPVSPNVNSAGQVFSSGPQNSTYVYRISRNATTGNSLTLNGSARITFGSSYGACNETIKIYVDGNITLNDNALMTPTQCSSGATKVEFYIGPNGSITLNSNGELNTNGSSTAYNPKYFQIYMYGNTQLNFNNNGTSSAFIFAPNAQTQFSLNGTHSGYLWTGSFTAGSNATIVQYPVSYSDLPTELQPAPTTTTKINLANVSSWQRQSVN
ncbi:MAG: hypothetical protein WCO29_04750 [Nostocales cyanobacterium ELA583]